MTSRPGPERDTGTPAQEGAGREARPATEAARREAEAARPAEGRQWAMAPSMPAQPTTSGWLTFGGTVIGLVGIFNIIGGLTSILKANYFVISSASLLVFDFFTWGWIWLGLGILQVAVGVGAVLNQTWARAVGVVLAGLAAIGHLAFLAAFPLWSLIVIGMSVLVIYALVVPPSTPTRAPA